VVSIFVDKTALDSLARNTACPMMITLLNYTMDSLVSDVSKKVAFFNPELYLTVEQRSNPDIKKFMRALYNYATEKFLDAFVKLYNRGGFEFINPEGGTYMFVPVLAFAVTDMEEAKKLKELYQGYRARTPCHLCRVTFKNAGAAMRVEEFKFRQGSEDQVLVNRYLRYHR